MKVFVAVPFSQFCDDNEDVIIKNRPFFEKMILELKKLNIDYFLSIEREDYGLKYISPTESVTSDYKAINESDLVIAILGNPISGGVHVELGWASALKKKIIILKEKNVEYSPMIDGMNALTNTKYVEYKTLISDETIKILTIELEKNMR